MTIKQRLYASIAALGTVGLLVSGPAQLCAQTAAAIDNDDIGGDGADLLQDEIVQMPQRIAQLRHQLAFHLRQLVYARAHLPDLTTQDDGPVAWNGWRFIDARAHLL